MKNANTVAGKIIRLQAHDTRYGRRAQALIERVDFSTGEVFEVKVVGWQEEAIALEKQGLGKDVGITGYWKNDDQDRPVHFNAQAVSPLRIIDPATVDLSKYL